VPTLELRAGASGYAFEAWQGGFYPARIAPEAMLAWYAERLPSVEINHSFYRMPQAEVLERWAQATPEAFCFSIKAPRRITHDARLAADAAADAVAQLYGNLATLGARRGPVLFQLPPFLKKDAARLRDFLHRLPAGHRAAFEFRHDSWFDDEIYALLQAAGAALCLSEREGSAPPPLVQTAPWGYVRLRLEHYGEADLARWVERLAATRWQQVHVYFMHEPTAPGYAAALLRLSRAADPSPPGSASP
jgi:uncharacterized protein YecE (DUF72 family)